MNLHQKSCIIIAHGITRNCGIKVLFGDVAATNGEYLVLPYITEFPSEKVWLAYQCYTWHEGGHVRETNFKVFGTSPALNHVVNILEDIRIERAMGNEFPGLPHLFREGAELILGQRDLSEGTATSDFFDLLLFFCRLRFTGAKKLESQYTLLRNRLEGVFPPDFLDRVEERCSRVLFASSTDEVARIAEGIMLMVESYLDPSVKPEPPEQDSSDADAGSEGSNSDDDTTTPDEDTKPGGSQQPVEGSAQDEEKDFETDNTKTIDDDGQEPFPDDENGEVNVDWSTQGAVRQSLPSINDFNLAASDAKDMADELRALLNNHVDPDANPSAIHMPDVLEPNASSFVPLPALQVSIAAEACGELRRAVMANTQKGRRPSFSGTRLNRSKLAQLSCGINVPPFYSRAPRKEPDTYVHVLVDASYSMEGEQMHTANLVMNGLLEALSGIPGIEIEASAFSGSWDSTFVIPFDPKNKNMGFQVYDSTPLGSALLWPFNKASLATQRRKVVFVITDGEPDSREEVREVARLYKSKGIQLVGILINMQTQLFDTQVHIQTAEQLPDAIRSIWEELLYPECF